MYMRSSFKPLMLCKNKKVCQHDFLKTCSIFNHAEKDRHGTTEKINFNLLRKNNVVKCVSTACFLSCEG